VLADGVEDDIVRLPVLREVFVQVVDHLIGPKQVRQLDVLRVADGADVRAEVFRDLHAADADRARGAVDKDAVALLDVGVQERHRAQRAVGHGGSLLVRHPVQDARNHAFLAHAHVLRIRP